MGAAVLVTIVGVALLMKNLPLATQIAFLRRKMLSVGWKCCAIPDCNSPATAEKEAHMSKVETGAVTPGANAKKESLEKISWKHFARLW